MISVEKHISDLLYTNDCVIIPQFGAFVASRVSAQIDTEKNILMPPTKQIGFNRSLSHNDGLLISTYANRNGMSYNEARVEVDNFRADLVEKLEEGLEIVFEKVGVLKRDSIGNVQFVSSKENNFLADSFGLTSFHFKPELEIKPYKENTQVKRLLRPLSSRQIAATVALIIGLFAISPSVNNSLKNYDLSTASAFDFVKNESVVKDKIVDAEMFTEESKPEDLTVEEEPAVVEQDQFFLIAGSFKLESQAEEFLAFVKRLGEEQAYILKSSNERYRIVLDGFANKPEAVNSLNNYRKLKNFKTVWVLKQ